MKPAKESQLPTASRPWRTWFGFGFGLRLGFGFGLGLGLGFGFGFGLGLGLGSGSGRLEAGCLGRAARRAPLERAAREVGGEEGAAHGRHLGDMGEI